jgi:hypothetical protein
MHRPGLISIWFFIGALLLMYGALIFGAALLLPTPPTVVHADLHAGIWWGALLMAVGAFWSLRFGPWKTKK